MDPNTRSLICNTVTDFPDVQADLLWRRAAVFGAGEAQRRWTLLFSVCRWFSIRRIVAKKKRRSVPSHLYPLQNPRGIHSTDFSDMQYFQITLQEADLRRLQAEAEDEASDADIYRILRDAVKSGWTPFCLTSASKAKAQRRWTLLFSVGRWFSIRRIVAKKAHDTQNQRYISVLSHLYPLQNPHSIHSTRPPFAAYNAQRRSLMFDVLIDVLRFISALGWFRRRIVAKKAHVWDGGDVKEGMEANGFRSKYGTILALSSSRRTSKTNLGLYMQPEISHAKDEVNSITYEELEKHFGKKLEDVAQIFDVSRSTFKRICRKKGIRRWKWSNRSKVYNSPSRRDPLCSDSPTEKLVATAPHMTPLVTPPPEARTITVKATCGDDMIKFQLPFSSRMMELEEEVSKRLKLDVGTYKIKYTDDDGDRILIACDKDLQDCMSAPNSLEMNTVKMFIEPITNNL